MAFVARFFGRVLEWLGFRNRQGKVLFVGLDNAGKTTLLHVLKESRATQAPPTHHPTHETVQLGRVTITAYDMGGHKQARKLWQDYATAVNAIIFLVDAADRDRLPEARHELDRMLADEKLAKVPILVLGNKVDVGYACSEPEFRREMGLLYETTGKDSNIGSGMRPLEVFMCSVLNKFGYHDGITWISQYLSIVRVK